jgi:UDP-N-acetylglucosamine 2-epimerase (non-hydrolysing)
MEPLLRQERPDVLLVEGDTNSVLAGALCAQKSGIAVGHVEAGLRSYDRSMPEEINRILTDHLSEYLFAPTDTARNILLREGVGESRIHVTGNTVVDELERQRARAGRPELFRRFDVEPGRYAVATVHRAENTDDAVRLRGIFDGLAGSAEALGIPVLAALHPRTTTRLERSASASTARARAAAARLSRFPRPSRRAALTSHGLRRAAGGGMLPARAVRDAARQHRAPRVGRGRGQSPGRRRAARIVECARAMSARPRDWRNPFGDGRSGERIVDLLTGGS